MSLYDFIWHIHTMDNVHCTLPLFKSNKQKQDQQLLSKSTHSIWRGWGGDHHFLHYIKLKDVHTVEEHNTGSLKKIPNLESSKT